MRAPPRPSRSRAPAKARAQTCPVCERYGAVWVCQGETKEAPPEFPFAETPGFRTVLTGPYRFRALGPRVIENALDVVHLGYGRRTFRSRSQGGSHLATDPDGTARAR